MLIREHRLFKKSYKKLPIKIKKKVINTIKQFKINPQNPILKNHKLHGELIGKRSISVTGDVRIIFEEYENYTVVLMINVGSHNQVY